MVKQLWPYNLDEKKKNKQRKKKWSRTFGGAGTSQQKCLPRTFIACHSLHGFPGSYLI